MIQWLFSGKIPTSLSLIAYIINSIFRLCSKSQQILQWGKWSLRRKMNSWKNLLFLKHTTIWAVFFHHLMQILYSNIKSKIMQLRWNFKNLFFWLFTTKFLIIDLRFFVNTLMQTLPIDLFVFENLRPKDLTCLFLN